MGKKLVAEASGPTTMSGNVHSVSEVFQRHDVDSMDCDDEMMEVRETALKVWIYVLPLVFLPECSI